MIKDDINSQIEKLEWKIAGKKLILPAFKNEPFNARKLERINNGLDIQAGKKWILTASW